MHRCSIQSSRLLPGFFAVLSHSHERGTQVDRNKVYSHNLITVLLSTLQLSRFFHNVRAFRVFRSLVHRGCSIAHPLRFVKHFFDFFQNRKIRFQRDILTHYKVKDSLIQEQKCGTIRSKYLFDM